MYSNRKVLLVDDDRDILETGKILLGNRFQIQTADTVQKAKKIVAKAELDAIVVDLNFEGQEEDGLDLINFVIKSRSNLPFVILSGDHNTQRVVNSMQLPLVDFIPKTGDHEKELENAINKAIDKKIMTENIHDRATFQFQTKSLKLKAEFENLNKVLTSSFQGSILITGESGTGKEYMAKYIAGFLGVKSVAANMASIPKELAESELFGHAKGAFTGADKDKIGLIEKADNGVFLLDEIGECPPTVQAKLLRVLQEKEICPIGSSQPRKVNVRFVAATHRNLQEMVEEGEFRNDLLQRINTFTFQIPALRDRPEDIKFYTNIFIEESAKGQYYMIKDSAMETLSDYHWPGNVRELRNVIERAVVYSDKRVLDKEIILRCLTSSQNMDNANLALLKEKDNAQALINALHQTYGNRREAAKLLGVSKATVHRWIKEYQLENKIPKAKKGRPYIIVEGENE